MILLSTMIGTLCGVLSGLGVGGGSLLILYLQHIVHFPQMESQFVNLMYFLPSSFFALILHTKHKLVDFSVALPAIAAGTLTALLFSYIASLLNPVFLRQIFGFFVILIGFRELRSFR